MDRLDAMQAFVRLAEGNTFADVASELRVRQSTVSKWLAELEAQIGVQLIERTTRTRRVTEAGQRFYERARDLVASYAQAVAEASARETTVRGRLRVSVPVVFGRLFVLPHIAALLRRHDELELELTFNDRYVNLIEEGYDVALRVGIPIDSTLRTRKLGETARVLVASPSYLAKHGAPRSPRDLAQHQCLLHSDLSTPETWVFRGRGGEATRAQVRGRFGANNSEALLAMARAGLGVALLAEWLVFKDLERGRLVALLEGHGAPTAPIHALTAPTRHQQPRIRAFVEHLAERFARAPSALAGAAKGRRHSRRS
ncbi:MAG: LysR family transcriptional regulator [Myxococcales bacterium]|nr:LysR family transcriptional regulator [Myxococcales bacterium]